MRPLAVSMLAALLLGMGCPAMLRRTRALDRRPGLAAWLWLVLPIGALSTLALAAGLLVVADHASPTVRLSSSSPACAAVLTAGLTSLGRIGLGVGAGTLAVLGIGAVIGPTVVTVQSRRRNRRHRELLALAAVGSERIPGVRVLEHPCPVAYSLPGWPATIVLSSGTLACLDDEHVDAIVAHERAHQRGRHHTLVLVAEALRTGFPWLPAARQARHQVERSLELAADDVAVRRCGPAAVTQALVRLGDAPAPPAGLRVAGPTAAERITRLTRPPAHAGRLLLAGNLASVGAALLLPLLGISDPIGHHLADAHVPLTHMAGMGVCPPQ